MTSLAAETRSAVRERPFLLRALRAGAVNYTAAAAFLDLDGDREAVATALRRFADDLPPYRTAERDARVTMKSGVGAVDDPADALVSVGGIGFEPDAGEETAVVATGDVDAAALAAVLDRLRTAGVDVAAAGVAAGSLAVIVGRRDGATAVRTVEAVLIAVPDRSNLSRTEQNR
ncbi:DUF7523 family protein [Halegenticoccus tardaugens]|uniref:DUF7523 family protein n=1 Tax=Halegenticoccus tardaugens TaxID=2071624 RepID=UPI00100A4EAB|nr:hypothetical protein [Halegenticoccus tardaugens]